MIGKGIKYQNPLKISVVVRFLFKYKDLSYVLIPFLSYFLKLLDRRIEVN